MTARGENPFPYTQLMRVDEPWLSHVLANALYVYRLNLETRLTTELDPKTRFDLRLSLCETRAAQEQVLALTVNEIGKDMMGHGY